MRLGSIQIQQYRRPIIIILLKIFWLEIGVPQPHLRCLPPVSAALEILESNANPLQNGKKLLHLTLFLIFFLIILFFLLLLFYCCGHDLLSISYYSLLQALPLLHILLIVARYFFLDFSRSARSRRGERVK
ncbi:hypothetical protein M9H77_08613 [Catharanthus roseus]|uniref:Uncharacterized protein n=1 Tax=Catharanthus roseus TaxID=4058 RepID=A0ACC0BY89_CATRO|nr:hypothetical protein M9H77_08613 [Catharanthus roseus]